MNSATSWPFHHDQFLALLLTELQTCATWWYLLFVVAHIPKNNHNNYCISFWYYKYIYTCFPLFPAYRNSENIFCIKLILANLCFNTIAAHIPITSSWLGLGRHVWVHSRRMAKKMGALVSNSSRTLFQLNCLCAEINFCRKIELVLSEHINTSSFRTSFPIFFRTYFLVTRSFNTLQLLPVSSLLPVLYPSAYG